MSKRKRIILLVLVVFLLLGVTLAVASIVGYIQQPPPPVIGPDTGDHEMFHGVEVAAKQILFKLDHCPSVDAQSLTAEMTKFAKELTNDDSMVVNQIGNGCLFLARSSRLTVPQLLTAFNSSAKVKQHLASLNLTSNLAYAEPNFVIRAKPNKGDGPVGPQYIKDSSGKSRGQLRRGERTIGLIRRTEPEPNDAYFQSTQQWGLKNTPNPGIDIDAVSAWQRSIGSPSIVVGVIDTGFDYDHPDLMDNVWKAPNDFDVTLGTETIHCSKDSHGYNAIALTPERACDPTDEDDGHGTHVTGIIGAVGNNEIGVAGVNWQTSLMGLKFIGPFGGLVSDAIKTIEFAVQVQEKFPTEGNVRVLNASWGYGGNARLSDVASDVYSNALRDEIALANERDVLFVASAGEDDGNDNDVYPHYPSGYDLPNVVSVTAIDQFGALAEIGGPGGSLSNHGSTTVHLAAPGTVIYSTYPRVLHDDGYFQKSGTSMATPFVSGAAALILSVNGCDQLHASELKSVILGGVVTSSVLNQISTRGRLNVNKSIALCHN